MIEKTLSIRSLMAEAISKTGLLRVALRLGVPEVPCIVVVTFKDSGMVTLI